MISFYIDCCLSCHQTTEKLHTSGLHIVLVCYVTQKRFTPRLKTQSACILSSLLWYSVRMSNVPTPPPGSSRTESTFRWCCSPWLHSRRLKSFDWQTDSETPPSSVSESKFNNLKFEVDRDPEFFAVQRQVSGRPQGSSTPYVTVKLYNSSHVTCLISGSVPKPPHLIAQSNPLCSMWSPDILALTTVPSALWKLVNLTTTHRAGPPASRKIPHTLLFLYYRLFDMRQAASRLLGHHVYYYYFGQYLYITENT